MLWEEHKIMGNTEICPPRHQLFVTQGLLDLEVVVLEKKKKKKARADTSVSSYCGKCSPGAAAGIGAAGVGEQ